MTGILDLQALGTLAEWSEGTMASGNGQAELFAYRTRLIWQSADGKVSSGQWACEPGEFAVADHPPLDYCRVLSGELWVIDGAGVEQVFGQGDSFVISKGYSGRWRITKSFLKEVVVICD